jgi:hypothetical protein
MKYQKKRHNDYNHVSYSSYSPRKIYRINELFGTKRTIDSRTPIGETSFIGKNKTDEISHSDDGINA